MKQVAILKQLMFLFVACSLITPNQSACSMLSYKITKLFDHSYSKPVCFLICTYLVVRTIGYLINDPVEVKKEIDTTDSENKNSPQNTEPVNPIASACLVSVVAALANNSINAVFNWSSHDPIKFITVENFIKGQKPIEKLIGSPREVAIEIYNSILVRYLNNITTTNYIVYGEMGCGKTELMRAVACKLHEQIGADAIFVTGSKFNTRYGGDGASRVRSIIEEAKKRTLNGTRAVLICIDEIESFGGRNTVDKGIALTQSQTINELIAALSEIEGRYPITLIGATNYIEKLDGGIQRRCDPPHEVKCLTKEERYIYVKERLERYSINPSIKPSDIINLIDNVFSASFIEKVFGRALVRVKNGSPKHITLKDFAIAAKGSPEHYENYNKNDPKVEREELIQRNQLIEAIRKSEQISYGEAEDIERKATGYKGKRMYGEGGSISKNRKTQNDIWEEEQRWYTRNQEYRSNKHLQFAAQQNAITLKGEQRAEEQEARNRELHQYARNQEERAQWNDKFRKERLIREREQDRRSKEAHEDRKAIWELGLSGTLITGVGGVATIIAGPATWSAAAAAFFWTAGPVAATQGTHTVYRNYNTIKRWFGF